MIDQAEVSGRGPLKKPGKIAMIDLNIAGTTGTAYQHRFRSDLMRGDLRILYSLYPQKISIGLLG
jgi:hypothetical protein